MKKDRSEVAITTAHDLYASVAAQVSHRLGTVGPNTDAVTHYVSKNNQQETLKRLGCRIGDSCTFSLKNSFFLSKFENLVYPVVVKPVEGSASHGIKKCQSKEEVFTHLKVLEKKYNDLPEIIPDGQILIETFVCGPEYCVEIFDGKFVGVMKKNKRTGNDFIERGYSSETNLSEKTIGNIIEISERVVEEMNLSWGPVHIDCIVQNNDVHIVEVNPRIAGSFITSIIRDGWGFDIADALLRKLRGESVIMRRLTKPEKFAQVTFFLETDPEFWNIKEAGIMSDANIKISFSPQIISARERRSYLYIVVE